MIATVLDAGSATEFVSEVSAAGLPVSYVAEPGRRFYRFEDDAGVLGYGGIEGTGPDRLLRSLVVRTDRRGRGSGLAMLAAIERAAADDGALTLFLLTTTAEAFFGRQGYAKADRAEAPAGIMDSAAFRSLCPANAAFLCKRIA